MTGFLIGVRRYAATRAEPKWALAPVVPDAAIEAAIAGSATFMGAKRALSRLLSDLYSASVAASVPTAASGRTSVTTSLGGFGGAGIFAGVDDIVERHLGIAEIGASQPRFRHLSACQSLNGKPPLAFDATSLIAEVLALLEARLRASGPARTPSAQNWRLEKQLWIAPHNTSGEKTLEKAIARVSGDAWANQVPTASGLINGTNDKHRNLDLVFRRESDGFELIELKMQSDTPLASAGDLMPRDWIRLINCRTSIAVYALRPTCRRRS
jgi:hypothetical protein